MIGGLKYRAQDSGKFKIHFATDPRLLLVLLAFCEKNVVRYIVLIISMIPIIGIVSNFIIPTAYIVLLLAYFQKYGAHVSIKEVSVVLFVFFAILASCVLYPENAKYILDSNNFWNTIFPCLRYFIVGLIILPDKKTLDILGKASCVAIIVETLFVIIYMMPRGLMRSDDMSRAYQILPNVLFALNYSFNKKKFVPWLISSVGIIYCISMGTRGPIAVILVYLFVRIIQSSSLRNWGKVFTGIITAGIGYFFLNSDWYLPSLRFLRTQFLHFGLSTRVLDLAINGTIASHLSGRDELYEVVIRKISERPYLGYGVYGEWPWIGWSAHNMALEMMAHYGVILGSILLLWLIVISLKSYIKTPNSISKEMILIWMCYVYVRGIFGGSYLQFGVFFMIGFCLREIRRIQNDYYCKDSKS